MNPAASFSWVYTGFLLVCLACQIYFGVRGDSRWAVYGIMANGAAAIYNLVMLFIDFKDHHYADTGWNTFGFLLSVWCIWWLWRNWKDKKKVKEALGAKSKALRDKLVRKVREGSQPRPVKVPV